MPAAAPSRMNRAADRIRALSKADLPCEQINTLQLCVLEQALKVDFRPAFLVLPTRETANQEFLAWSASQAIADELRMMLAMNLWPGPEETPSPARMIAEPALDRVAAVTLYDAPSDGPWSQLWRERLIKFGLYAVFFSPAGKVGVLLAHRGEHAAAFSGADAAFVRNCVNYIGGALDVAPSGAAQNLMPAETVHLRLDDNGKIAALSFLGAEMLRDLEGGGAGALEAARARVERALAFMPRVSHLSAQARASMLVAGPLDERAFRQSIIDLMTRYPTRATRPELPIRLGENGFGRFELWPSLLLGVDGAMEVVTSLTRYVPALALRLRGAIAVNAPAREMQLICAMRRDKSLKDAAQDLDVTEETARTLGKRLTQRAGQTNLRAALDRLTEIGQTHWAATPGAPAAFTQTSAD